MRVRFQEKIVFFTLSSIKHPSFIIFKLRLVESNVFAKLFTFFLIKKDIWGTNSCLYEPEFFLGMIRFKNFFLDVNDIKFVINYDYPNTSEDYVHRIGRTGRRDKKVSVLS